MKAPLIVEGTDCSDAGPFVRRFGCLAHPCCIPAGRSVGMKPWVIEDEEHCEYVGSYDSEGAALAAIRGLARIHWDEAPNRAPCMSWRTCGRRYAILGPHAERREVLEVSSAGAVWIDGSANASE